MKEINNETYAAAGLTADENNVGSIPGGGLEYHGTLPGAVYPDGVYDSGTTDVHLALRPGAYTQESDGRISGNSVIGSIFVPHDSSGTEYVNKRTGFSIKSNGNFAFGAYQMPSANLKFFVENEEGETGEFQVNCSSIILRGQIKMPYFVLGTGFANKALTVSDDGRLVSGDSNWHEATLTSAFKPYDNNTPNTPKYRKINNIVEIRGRISPKSVLAGSVTSTTIFTLPKEFRPSVTCQYVCQGSGKNTWLLGVSSNGTVTFSRYGCTSFIDCPTNAWLTFSVTYMCGSDMATTS